jgi:probable HAF family extracellular repeat protein
MSPRPLAVLLPFVLCVASVSSAQTYRLVELGTLGGPYSSANAINNKGDAVGQSTLKSEHVSHAVLWSKGKITDLGVLPGFVASDAVGISDGGAIVGEAWTPSRPMDERRAVSWSAGKANALAVAVAETPCGSAFDVNDDGLAVGRANLKDPTTRSGARASVVVKGQPMLLPQFTLPDKAGVSIPEIATAVNRAGVVVGAAQGTIDGTSRRRPFRWANGVASDPLLGFDRTNRAWASDVNDAGDIALQRVIPGDGNGAGKGTWQALILRGDKVTEIAPLAGYANAAIRALNARGDAVGYCWNATGGTVPMVVRNGRALDPNQALLAPSDWKIIFLTDVNDAGQAVGVAKKDGEMHAIRLDPGPATGMGLAEQAAVPAPTWTTAFAGARPNPATSSAGTQFAFTLATKATVQVTLTNVQGRLVRTLAGEFEAGPGALVWDGRDDSGARIRAGVLFARFAGPGLSDTKKVVVEN